MINWISKRCPVCGKEYEYPENQYEPKTCSQFECVWNYLHHPDKYRPLTEIIDESRREARI